MMRVRPRSSCASTQSASSRAHRVGPALDQDLPGRGDARGDLFDMLCARLERLMLHEEGERDLVTLQHKFVKGELEVCAPPSHFYFPPKGNVDDSVRSKRSRPRWKRTATPPGAPRLYPPWACRAISRRSSCSAGCWSCLECTRRIQRRYAILLGRC